MIQISIILLPKFHQQKSVLKARVTKQLCSLTAAPKKTSNGALSKGEYASFMHPGTLIRSQRVTKKNLTLSLFQTVPVIRKWQIKQLLPLKNLSKIRSRPLGFVLEIRSWHLPEEGTPTN